MAAADEVGETAGVVAEESEAEVVTEGEEAEEVEPELGTATASSVGKRATSAGSVLREVQTNALTAKRRVTCQGNAPNPALIVVAAAAVEAEGEVETEDVAEVGVEEEET